MRHEQYTCDRCKAAIAGSPKIPSGKWTITIGNHCIFSRYPLSDGHLCDQCLREVTTIIEAVCQALLPMEPPE